MLPRPIAGTGPHAYCFQCLSRNHAEDGVHLPAWSVEKATVVGAFSPLWSDSAAARVSRSWKSQVQCRRRWWLDARCSRFFLSSRWATSRRGFTAHQTHCRQLSCNPSSLTCGSVLRCPLKTKVPVACLLGFLRVTQRPHTPVYVPLADRTRLPPLQRDRDAGIFQQNISVGRANDNSGVKHVYLTSAEPQDDFLHSSVGQINNISFIWQLALLVSEQTDVDRNTESQSKSICVVLMTLGSNCRIASNHCFPYWLIRQVFSRLIKLIIYKMSRNCEKNVVTISQRPKSKFLLFSN